MPQSLSGPKLPVDGPLQSRESACLRPTRLEEGLTTLSIGREAAFYLARCAGRPSIQSMVVQSCALADALVVHYSVDILHGPCPHRITHPTSVQLLTPPVEYHLLFYFPGSTGARPGQARPLYSLPIDDQMGPSQLKRVLVVTNGQVTLTRKRLLLSSRRVLGSGGGG